MLLFRTTNFDPPILKERYQGRDGFSTLVVCNYAKAGNFRGAQIYKRGAACSACPPGYSCDAGLCAGTSTRRGELCNLSTTGLIQYNNENNLPPNISEANVVLCLINLFWYFLIYLHILDSIYKFLDTFIHFFVFSISYRNDDHHIFLPAHLQRTLLHLVAIFSVHMHVAQDRWKTQGTDSGQA